MTTTWVAPGRVNLIGEHVDYNNGLVLPFALPMATNAAVSRSRGDQVTVRSASLDAAARFSTSTQPGDEAGWAAYVAGVVWALGQWCGRLPGLDITVSSDVPMGAGLSSSAALECAVAAAINDELAVGLNPADLVSVARRAENDYVGLPNGGMDQSASILCRARHALLLDCRSNETEQVPLDVDAAGLRLLVIDTRVRHELTDGGYAQRRHECEQAATALDVPSLREATLEAVGGLSDARLRRRAQHVVSEIERVGDVAGLLQTSEVGQIGPYLTASHRSLRDDFEVSCRELDTVVDVALSAGALGARMTGGGFGGSAIALVRESDVQPVTETVAKAFADAGWRRPRTWTASACDGAHRV